MNLSNTGLDSDIIRGISDRGLPKARSLAVFHLSGNPGINKENIDFLRQRLKSHDYREAINIVFQTKEEIEADKSDK